MIFTSYEEPDGIRNIFCCAVVNLRIQRRGGKSAKKRVTVEGGLPKEKNLAVTTRYYGRKALIYRGGDDSREDPPVPIPNTEVKLSRAESTVRSLGREDR